MRIFKFTNYKKYLAEVIHSNAGVHGYKTQLARAAGCSNSYLSQVLRGDFELSPEHALGLANFWELTTFEKDYFVHLVLLARAGTKELRKYYESLCEKIAAEHERESERGRVREVDSGWKDRFYSSWHYTAIHDLTTFAGGQTAESVAKRLDLPRALAEEALQDLKEMGLVEKRDQGWQARIRDLKVDPGSLHGRKHVSNWIQRAALDVSRRKRPIDSYHLSWVLGVSREDYRRLRALIIEHLNNCERIVQRTKSEELVCLNVQLFPV